MAASPSLASAIETLRARGLTLRRGGDPDPAPPGTGPSRPPIPTGHRALDEALGTAGWPRGALASLDATPGSGATSLALGSLTACQAAGGLVAWLDLDATFDPAAASRLGVELPWLLVVRPQDANEAVELAAWLVRGGQIDLFVLDLGAAAGGHGTVPRPAIDRLSKLLVRAGGTGLMLGAGEATAGAAVRVSLERLAWLAVGRDLVGQRVLAHVERHRWALAGGTAELDLWFAEGRRIEPLLARQAQSQPIEQIAADERPALRVVGA